MSRRLKSFKQNRSGIIGLALIMLFFLCALLAPLLAPHDPTLLFADSLRLGPGSTNLHGQFFLLGTDDLGRDMLSRLLYGARISLGIGLGVVLLAMSVGVTLGMLAGFYGGKIDRIIMRIIDILMSLPSILLAIVVVAILGPGLANAIIAVSIVAVPNFTRIVRACVIQEKSRDYVIAAQSLGAPPWRILWREIMPNCTGPLIVQSTLGISDGILNVAGLGFLGLGAQAPLAEWGMMLSDARAYIETSPWLVTLPGLCILLTVVGFNLLGDGLRDVFDPKTSVS